MISLQTRLKALVDKWTPNSIYTAYELSSDEYVGNTDKQPEGFCFRVRLKGYGFLPSVLGIHLSAAKRHPDTGKLHHETRRKTPTDGDTIQHAEAAVDGTDLQDFTPEQLQYHVHVFGDGDVFSHLELRSDLHPIADESWSEAIGRLMIHYSPRHNQEYLPGETEPGLEGLL